MMDGDLFTDMKVHPAAAIFPMLSEPELQELADDIKANGLLHPIVRTLDGVIVDGRNRYKACGIAGVEPTFDDRKLTEVQIRALIVSANLQRRSMTTGQQAVAYAMLYPEPEKGGRGKLARNRESFPGVSARTADNLVSRARFVVNNAPDLAHEVLAGYGITLDAAYTETHRRLNGVADEEEQKAARLAALFTGAPDIAAEVRDGTISLEEGERRLVERQRHIAQIIRGANDALADLRHARTRFATIRNAHQHGFTAKLITPAIVAELEELVTEMRQYLNDQEEETDGAGSTDLDTSA